MGKRLNVMELVFIFVFGVIFSFGCDNPQNSDQQPKNSCHCDTPISLTCLQDSCVFFEVYNSDSLFVYKGVFVIDTSDHKFKFIWDGMDQNGISAPCGEYVIKITIVNKDSITTKCSSMLKGDDESKTATGRHNCDSLKNNCTGQYYEIPNYGEYNPDDGSFSENVGCLCCQ